jgi:hypothetical protein
MRTVTAKIMWAMAWFCLAIFLCILLAATYSFGTACPHPNQYSQQRPSGDHAENPCTFRESPIGRFIVWFGESVDADESPLMAAATCFLALVTLGLAVVTGCLYVATARIARESKEASAKALAASTRATKTLTRIERAYLTGGGDIDNRGGKKHFRIDVANYGKTAAYLTIYEIRFAPKLADVQDGPKKIYKPCKRTSSIFDDRIAPDNKTKVIGYIEMVPPDAEIIYGCFWYTDWRKKKRHFRFILRVEPGRIRSNADRTVPNVEGVDDSYREWD